jgi:hypothetical protein
MISKKLVEARELAYEIVEAAAGGSQLAQHEPGKRACRRCPQQQGQMREVTPLSENANQVGHQNKSAPGQTKRDGGFDKLV